MSWNNKVVWSEGLFLRPQHFQQHDRYVEHLVEERCGHLRHAAWGFRELSIDSDLLAIGKFSIAAARGVLPDGTPFNIPEDHEPPAPLDVADDMRSVVVYLSLPARHPGTLEVDVSGDAEGLARLRPRDYDVRDATSQTVSNAVVQVGMLRLRYLLEAEPRGEYACMGVARIVEARADKKVVLDDDYVPPVMDCQASPQIAGFVNELQGLLHHRGEAIAARVSDAGRGASEMANFLLLQAINRYEPLAAHLAGLSDLHPELLYRHLLQIAGELATFDSTRRPRQFPTYRHDALQETFTPVRDALRESLTTIIEQPAVPIPMKERKYGIRLAKVADRSLLSTASFVLAVSASLPAEQIRQTFPAQVKIGPVDKIKDLVNLALPGIVLRPLPVAPRQIPYHTGNVYFELDRASEYWAMVRDTGGFAFHLGGDFPGVQMEFWAIRG